MELEKDLYRIGMKIGYLIQPVQGWGLYIEPAIHIGYAFGDEKLKFNSGRVVEKEGYDVTWPAINVGWKLNL